MRTLTGMGGLGNARELAEALRQMGRGPDTMLAHITPEEAQMLLEAGGSGRINPQTGLPEFQPEYNYDVEAQEGGFYGETPQYTGADFGFEVAQQQMPQPIDYRAQMRAAEPTGYYGAPTEAMQQFAPPPDMSQFDIGFGPGQFQPAAIQAQGLQLPTTRGTIGMAPEQFERFTAAGEAGGGISPEQERSFRQNYPLLSRALGTGIASLPAIYFARQARGEGRAAERELRAMAQPIREQAEALRQQALSGGLTPQQARQQEARRAQLRQSAAGRGATTGTQEAMIENTLSRERAGLAQTNLENAMRQLGLANTVTEAAIRARLASDRDVNNTLLNIYNNIAFSAARQPTGRGPASTQPSQILPDEQLFPQPTVQR